MTGYVSRDESKGTPVIVFVRPDGKRVVIAGNQTDQERSVTVGLGKKHLNMAMPPHSFHSYIEQ
jgi:O-glycosyl hydrolase